MSGRRVVITGGAGFLGSHLCERFLADGDEVVLRGRAGAVELGEVRGRVEPA